MNKRHVQHGLSWVGFILVLLGVWISPIRNILSPYYIILMVVGGLIILFSDKISGLFVN